MSIGAAHYYINTLSKYAVDVFYNSHKELVINSLVLNDWKEQNATSIVAYASYYCQETFLKSC
jgi:hypothetical protein